MGALRSAILLTALATRLAIADPPTAPSQPSQCAVVQTLGCATASEQKKDRTRAKIVAAASIGGIHLAYATWSYFAWYRDSEPNDFFIGHDTWFSVDGYAGGADKLGHFWSNYALTRATTGILTAAGWRRLPSSLVSAGLTEVAFTLTEIQDGFVKYGFDPKDMIADVAGAGVAVLMDNVPSIDRLFDFRLQYFPSSDYRRTFRDTGSLDVGQDYTGQSYMLAMHLGGIPRLADRDWGYWSRFVDVVVGYEAHYYEPIPDVQLNPPRQTLYAGLSINMQGVLRSLFDDSLGRRIGIGAFEVYSLPLTTFRYVEASRRREPM